ncbi:hypothetical protein FRUB_04208 [Fimbriiglobus ruber]|uniref:Uncharacterized protein n=2 Tax=Fimbriiglobus ruber TaxID=1908690 RepID=A0A225DKW7_9BACT|nr:hypothetical protein FRUB_04208 [Fimbriiglobus ruber]
MAVEMIERHIEQPVDEKEYYDVFRAAREAAGDPDQFYVGDIDHHPGMAAYRILTLTPKSSFVINAVAVASHAARASDTKVEEKAQINLIRDIFGNPFRPVIFDPTWLTSTAIALATQMYESQDFSLMPILADALQDANCCDDQVLGHCREPGFHVRGCWVIDLLTGRS